MSSGSGDIGGEVSGEEAAWRDLIARFDMPGEKSAVSVPWPAVEDLPDTGPITAEQPEVTEAPGRGGTDGPGPADRTRVIRPAGDPRAYSPAEEVDERYVPEPLPPPAKLDGLSKAAWTALICGPGYLLFGTMLGWTISGTEAVAAIAAFIAGFVILVVKMSDRPPRDDNDDGAVL
jgi:hypothetical protein